MKPEAELIATANQSYLGSYRKLVQHSAGGEIREGGGVFAFVTGLPVALFNGCVVVERTGEVELGAALDWIARQDVPHRMWIDEAVLTTDLADVAITRGYRRDDEPYPGMILHPVSKPPPPSDGVSVVAVSEPDLDRHIALRIEGGIPPAVARSIYSRSFAADPDIQIFTALLDGRPVGNALAIRTGEVSGVYDVGTLPEARRRGVGTAASWAAVAAGIRWGCDPIVLQASEMGAPVYASMGFRTVVRYAVFRRPPKS